jgi:hypothetical protein
VLKIKLNDIKQYDYITILEENRNLKLELEKKENTIQNFKKDLKHLYEEVKYILIIPFNRIKL